MDKKLGTLLEYAKVEILKQPGTGDDYKDSDITALVYDSRKIEEGCLFVCIKGANFDGHSKIAEAVEKKAAAVLVEYIPEDQKPVLEGSDVIVIRVDDTREGLGITAAAWFGHPAKKLKTIGITGTKGKTTSTYIVKNILENAGFKVGLIGTIEICTGSRVIPAKNTTPESYLVQEYFAEMVENKCDAVVMEVSSQGLMLSRVAGFTFDYGIFTNLSPDHIGKNEHKDFDDYLRCKKMLFSQCRTGIFNSDDKYFSRISEGCTCEVETFGTGEKADLRAYDLKPDKRGGALCMTFKTSGSAELDAMIDLPGSFSVYNALTAIAICLHFGVDKADILEALEKVSVKGRIEMLPVSDDYTLMIDYAHNAMALNSLLTTLKEYDPGRIVALFGCGGGRDRDRRFEMGETSGNLADFTIITSDNPRNEEPMDIIADIEEGIKKTSGEYVTVPDRKEAIGYAIDHAKKGDVIVLAGKGHEDYQEIKGVRHPMDERVLVRELLSERGIPVRF